MRSEAEIIEERKAGGESPPNIPLARISNTEGCDG
jgi:hypothetical protein